MVQPEQHKTRIQLTGDGSHTLYSGRFGQYFHNPNGAIAESRHVFFETPGIRNRLNGSRMFNILEVGFGTGLNLLLLLELIVSMEKPPAVSFRSVERFPITQEQAKSLNYPGLLNLDNGSAILASIFRKPAPGYQSFRLNDHVSLELFVGSFEEMPVVTAEENRADAIFFDPFSPEVNPELWTPAIFEKLASCSSPDVILATYGAASGARAAMAVAGWSVARAPGALGKREMTLAARDPERLAGFKRVNEKRLAERYLQGGF